MATGSRLLVGAIDFGTSYTGWAFSFKYENEKSPPGAYVKNWYGGTLTTEKTPTCLLLKSDGTFDSFGYDAEKRYGELSAQNVHSDYFFFKNFKMKLYKEFGKDIKREMIIRDEIGKEFPAVDVFAISLKYLVEDMSTVFSQRISGELLPTDIGWVLTVPAIWSDASKQFMREAAIKAGINKDHLIIALEPEAASIYCLHLPVDASDKMNERAISNLPVGSKYMVLDAGGGTIDITVHEVQKSNTLREVRAANGGAWGGIMVNKAFEDFLRCIVGDAVIDYFKMKETEDWLYMLLQFEAKKRELEINSPRYITLRLPISLTELCKSYNGMVFQDAVAATRYAEIVEIVRDKLKLSKVVFFYMFGPTMQNIVDHVKSLFRETSLREIDTILTVGGFSESRLLQQALKEALPSKEIIIPPNSSASVLRGAVMYGHFPKVINSRVLKYTYGVNNCRAFKEGYHREEKKINTDAGLRCYDIFDIFCSKNSVVKSGETYIKKTFFTVKKYQRAMSFSVFISEKRKPTYVDEDGCLKIGEIRLRLDDPVENLGRKATLSMVFGDTEIIVEAEDERTGNKIKAVIDFLG